MAAAFHYYRHLKGLSRNARLFLVSTVLNGLGLALFVLLYNLYILSVGFHEDMIGLINLVASLVAVVAALPVGWAASRLGYRAAQIIGTLGSVLSLVFPLLVPSAWAFIVTELIWGVAYTMVIIVTGPFITENSSEEDRPYLFSLQFVLVTLTTCIGTLLGGELPRILSGWFGVGAESPVAYQGALWIGTGLLFLSALPLAFLKEPKARHAQIVRPRFVVHRPRHVARLLLPTVVAAAGGGMFVPFVNVFWKATHNLNDATIGQLFALSALLMTALGLIAPLLSRRLGLVRLMVFSQTLAVISLLAFGFSPWLLLAVAGFLGRDAMMNLSRPLNSQFQMERSDAAERAAVSSLSTMLVNLTWGIGSWVSGIWQTEGNYALVFIGSAAFYLVAAALLQVLFGARHGAAAQPEIEDAASGLAVAAASPAE